MNGCSCGYADVCNCYLEDLAAVTQNERDNYEYLLMVLERQPDQVSKLAAGAIRKLIKQLTDAQANQCKCD